MVTTSPGQEVRDPLLLAYDERLRRLRRDPKTITMFRQTARRFQAYLDDLGVAAADVEPWALEEYFAGLDLAPSTKGSHLKRLRSAYGYAQRRGLVPADPTSDVQLERLPDSEPCIVPNHALRSMKERIAADRQWAQFHLLTYAGLRRQEIIQLDWSDVDLATSTLTVLGKGGKLRKVPIHPALGEALTDLRHREGKILLPARGGAAIGDDTWDALLKTFAHGEYTAHDFRRTVASSLYHNGVEPDTIDKIMGWAPRAVRSRYYVKHASDALQRAILKLYADDPV
jgi:integrase/recombinase XerD